MLDPIFTQKGEGIIHRRTILGFLQTSAKYLGLSLPHEFEFPIRTRLSNAYDAGFNPPMRPNTLQKYETVV